MSDENNSPQEPLASADALPSQRGIATLVMILGAVGLALSIYLTIQGFTASSLPGCGADSDCSAVLGSRWSKVFGLPVALPASLLYVAMIVFGKIIHFGRSSQQVRMAWSMLAILSTTAALTAAWFIGLQYFTINATCPYCMATHAISLLLAIVVMVAAPFGFLWCLPRLVLAAVLTAGFAGVQLMSTPPATTEQRPVGHDFDAIIDGHRTIGVLDGKVGVRPADYPILGDPESKVVLVLLFDYTCYHCRTLHHYLLDAVERFDGDLAIVLMSTPLDVDCNPAVKHQQPAHETGCDLAEIALAVWKIDAKAFTWMDGYLTGDEDTRTVVDARAFAENLVDPDELQRTIDSGWPAKQIERFTTVYQMYGGNQLPALLGGGRITIGVPEDAEALIDDLRPLIESARQNATSP